MNQKLIAVFLAMVTVGCGGNPAANETGNPTSLAMAEATTGSTSNPLHTAGQTSSKVPATALPPTSNGESESLERETTDEDLCSALEPLYEARFALRSNYRQGVKLFDDTMDLVDASNDIAEAFPGNTMGHLMRSINSIVSVEGELWVHAEQIRELSPYIPQWETESVPVHDFARNCDNIPPGHVELPNVLDEIGITADQLSEESTEAQPQTPALDEENFKAAIRRIEVPDDLRSSINSDLLDAALERARAENLTSLYASVATAELKPWGLTDSELVAFTDRLGSMLEDAGFRQAAVICDRPGEVIARYDSIDGSIGPVYAVSFAGVTPPGSLYFTLPGAAQDDGIEDLTC